MKNHCTGYSRENYSQAKVKTKNTVTDKLTSDRFSGVCDWLSTLQYGLNEFTSDCFSGVCGWLTALKCGNARSMCSSARRRGPSRCRRPIQRSAASCRIAAGCAFCRGIGKPLMRRAGGGAGAHGACGAGRPLGDAARGPLPVRSPAAPRLPRILVFDRGARSCPLFDHY